MVSSTNPPVTIRTATADDAPAISRLAMRSKAAWGYTADQMEAFRGELSLSAEALMSRTAFVLECNGQLLAYYTMYPLKRREIYLEHLFVEPGHFGKGYGRALYEHAVETARALEFVRMRILADPHAAGFYDRLNAVRCREVPSSIPGRSIPLYQVCLQDHAPCIVQATTRADIEVVAPLFDAYRQFYNRSADIAAAKSFLIARLENDESVLLSAICGGRAVGFTQLYPSYSSVTMRPIWILNDLYVEPSSRRQGIGRFLLEEAAEFAAETGAVRLVLATAVGNSAAQALYESAGWRRDNEFLHFVFPVAAHRHGVTSVVGG